MGVADDITASFKLAMRRMTSPVCLITTRADDQLYGMTATAVQSVSADPPSLLICINRSASISRPLSLRGRFAVNVLRTAHADLVSIFSGKAENKDRFSVRQLDRARGYARSPGRSGNHDLRPRGDTGRRKSRRSNRGGSGCSRRLRDIYIAL